MNQNELIIYSIADNYVSTVGTAEDLAIDVMTDELKRWRKGASEFEDEAIDEMLHEINYSHKWRFNPLPYFRFKGNEAELQRALKCPGTLKRFLKEYSEVYEEIQKRAEHLQNVYAEL